MSHPTAECRDAECKAPIIWATSAARGRPMPIDVAPVDDGTILLTGEAHRPVAHVVDPAAPPLDGWPAPLRTPHHQTCPAADRWRGKPR